MAKPSKSHTLLPHQYGGPVEDGQSPRRKSSMGPQPTKPDTHYYTGARGPTTFPPATLATTATFAAKFLPPRPASEPPPKAWTWQTDTQIKFGRFRSKVESTYPQQLKRVKATWASSEAELFEAIMRKRFHEEKMVTLNDIYSVKPIGSFGFTPFTTNEWPRTLPKNRLFPNQRLVCFKFAERAFTFGGKKWEDKKWLSSLSASNMQETTRCERVAQMPQGVEKEMPKKYDVHVDQQDENQQDDNQQDER